MQESLNNNLLDHFKKLNIKKNDNIVVHADLTKFGVLDKNLAKKIILNLLKVIGKNGSLIMPSYILGVSNNYLYNIKKFKNKTNISLLTKVFFRNYNVFKSKSLVHSHIGIGKNSKFLLSTPMNKSFGKNTDFHYMRKNKFKLVLLGCSPQQGATYLHHVEAIFGVPYRCWLKIEKKIVTNKKKRVIKYEYFARKTNLYKTNLNYFFNYLKTKKIKIHKVKLRFGFSLCVPLVKLHNISIKILKQNPYMLVK